MPRISIEIKKRGRRRVMIRRIPLQIPHVSPEIGHEFPQIRR